MKEDKDIFREKALQKLSSPEQLDILLTVISPKGWIALFCLIGVIFATIIWAFFGSIPIKAKAHGIYLNYAAFRSLSTPMEGRLMELVVGPGDSIEKGQVFGFISSDGETQSPINATHSGTVIQIHTNVGELVKKHEAIISIQLSQEEDKAMGDRELGGRFYCFLSPAIGDSIRKGMHAKIRVWGVNPNLFGYIKGKVDKVSYLPVTSFYFKTLYLTESVIKHISKGDTVIPVIVVPEFDSKSVTRFKWTSKKQPPFKIPLGSVVTTYIEIGSRPPISFVFPLWYFNPLKYKRPPIPSE